MATKTKKTTTKAKTAEKSKAAKKPVAKKSVAKKTATAKKPEKSKVHLELYSYQLSFGKRGEIDLKDGVSRDDCEEARYNPFVSGLDVDDLGVEECTVDGKPMELDISKCERTVDYEHAGWSEYMNKTLVYALDVDKASWLFEFEVEGKFDPKKLELYCEEVIQPDGSNVTLFTRLYYGDQRISRDDSLSDNKGCYFWLFDKNRYTEIEGADMEGEEVELLDWNPFASISDMVDLFWEWQDWTEEDWKRMEDALRDPSQRDDIEAAWGIMIDSVIEGEWYQGDFLQAALKRNHIWAILANGSDISFAMLDGCVNLAKSNIAVSKVIDFCNENGGILVVNEDGLYCEDAEIDIDDSTVNWWTCMLRSFPELSDRCDSWDKFSGYSICRLLEVQPQLADKFSLKELGDIKSRCWKGVERVKRKKYGFDYGWDCLVKAQPQFAKYRK